MYEAGHPKPMLCENPEMPWGGQWGGGSGCRGQTCGQAIHIDALQALMIL